MGVLPVTELAIHPIPILITSANGQDVGYIFVGSGAEFFWGSGLVLSGMYLLLFALYRREKVPMVDITLIGEV
ncbi:hypothetical protein CGJ44_17290 [Vibrio parahaemolyticus]|nr:hypothetical protein CGJ44_17290 [Vibrio parahaemolyticus]TON78860.1 hypothetical protein CGH49_24180 [Vibrio parahaemolyticus]